MATPPTGITGREDPADVSAPVRALVDFYRAFNTGDLALMSTNWAQTGDVSMDNPVGGITRGWTEIRQVYDRIFHGPADVYVEFYDYTLHEGSHMFYVVGRERGQLVVGPKIIDLAIRTSRIYQWVDGRWCQVHHHGSIDDPELLATYQTAINGAGANGSL